LERAVLQVQEQAEDVHVFGVLSVGEEEIEVEGEGGFQLPASYAPVEVETETRVVFLGERVR
jgi:hypothetical protein